MEEWNGGRLEYWKGGLNVEGGIRDIEWMIGIGSSRNKLVQCPPLAGD